MTSLTCPVGWVGVLFATLDCFHGISECCTSLGPIEQGGVESMNKNLGGCNRYRPQGHKNTMSAGCQEGSG